MNQQVKRSRDGLSPLLRRQIQAATPGKRLQKKGFPASPNAAPPQKVRSGLPKANGRSASNSVSGLRLARRITASL